jgi:FMN-dependent NADH-azoreductase
MDKQAVNVLLVNSSARQQNSFTRRFAAELIEALRQQHGDISLKERNVADGLPFVDETWVEANFTADDERGTEHHAALSLSNHLVDELEQADVIVIGTPFYNFSVPASLKAWIDQVCRVGRTFNYTETGPIGLLKDKQAYVIMAAGGNALGSDIDFASGYLRHLLSFIGIEDVTFLSAGDMMRDTEQGLQQIRTQIAGLVQQVA